MALLTLYGASAGSFVISIKEADFQKGIALSENGDLEDTTQRVYAHVMENANNLTYTDLPLEKIWATDGNYPNTRKEYLAYTFYLVNNGKQAVDVALNVNITTESANMSDAFRFIIIEEKNNHTDYDILMFKRPDREEVSYSYQDSEKLQIIEFTGDIIIKDRKTENLEPNDFKKISIIVYLEGEDPDCNDDLILSKGSIQLKAEFNIVERRRLE